MNCADLTQPDSSQNTGSDCWSPDLHRFFDVLIVCNPAINLGTQTMEMVKLHRRGINFFLFYVCVLFSYMAIVSQTCVVTVANPFFSELTTPIFLHPGLFSGQHLQNILIKVCLNCLLMVQ